MPDGGTAEPLPLEQQWAAELEAGADPDTAAEETRLALAKQVCTKRRVGVIDANNTKLPGTKALEEAVANDDAFYGYVGTWMLVVDFDTEDAVERSHQLFALLLIDGYDPVLVASGQPGRRHLFCRIPRQDAEQHLKAADALKDVRLTTIRPPLTRHRMSGRSRLLLPPDPADALRALRGIRALRPLGAAARRAVHMARLPTGRTVSEQVFSVAMGAVNAGWSLEQFITVVTCRHLGIGKLLADRVEREGPDGWERNLRWLRDAVWPEAVEQVRAKPPVFQGPLNPEISELARRALTRSWPGRRGPAKFAVYMALVYKRATSGHVRFDAAQRDLAELAGISSRETVRKALIELQAEGELIPINGLPVHPSVQIRRSRTWELPVPEGYGDTEGLDEPKVGAVLHALGSDAFRNAIALGKSAERIYLTVIGFPGSTEEQIIGYTGIAARRVRQTLRLLGEHRLLWCDDDGHWIEGDQTLEHVAMELGSAGRLDRQMEQHRLERFRRDRSHR